MTTEGPRIGRYALVRHLGRGGAGDVFLARDEGLDRLVALKTVRSDVSEGAEWGVRLRHEARALAQLHHPNVAGIYALEQIDGLDLLAMEYVEGAPLAALIRPGAPMGVAAARAVATGIAAGLAAAHAVGVIHRDMKPANVMVRRDGAVKILDFGIALRAGADRLTRQGYFVGTLHYAPPESLDGAAPDARGDVYAAGATLYEVLTGNPPFCGLTETQIMRAKTERAPDPIGDDTDAALAAIVAKAMARDPADRYADPAALLAAITTLASDLREGAADLGRLVAAQPVHGADARLTAAFAGLRLGSSAPPASALPGLQSALALLLKQGKAHVAQGRALLERAIDPALRARIAALAPPGRRPSWSLVAGGAALLMALVIVTVLWSQPQPPADETAYEYAVDTPIGVIEHASPVQTDREAPSRAYAPVPTQTSVRQSPPPTIAAAAPVAPADAPTPARTPAKKDQWSWKDE